MIAADMRSYPFYTYGSKDGYGQPVLSAEPQGAVKLSVFVTSQSVQDNVLYKDAQYMALTHDSGVNDTYVIQYGEERLKVLYVQPHGRYKQVFMQRLS